MGLVASPNPVNLNVAFAGSTATQPLTIFYNGSPTPLNSVMASGQTWLQAFQSGSTGGITVNAIHPGSTRTQRREHAAARKGITLDESVKEQI